MRAAPPSVIRWIELVLVAIGLASGIAAYQFLFPSNFALLTLRELVLGFGVSLVSFWVALQISETGVLPLLFRQFCAAIGLSLIIQALLNYFQLLTRSFFLVLVGGIFAVAILGLARHWWLKSEGPNASILMLGYDPFAAKLANMWGVPVAGVLGSTSGVPDGMPVLGSLDQFAEVVGQVRPSHILVATPDWAAQIPPSTLLDLRFRGVTVVEVPALYEQLLERVYCRGFYPAEILLSPALRVDSRTMAIQAVYTNILGLAFLVALSPLLIMLAIAVYLFSDRGPVLEGVQCSGYQKIPFRLLRFRTLRADGSGSFTGIGKLISRLGLVHLPLLMNVVRGEMALVGPRPVREEFAQRLTQLLPFYSLRYFVKPGILNFKGSQADAKTEEHSELQRLEADLYYIKQASPGLDLEILLSALWGDNTQAPVSAAIPKAAG